MSLKRYLVELSIVVLGISIAFTLNNIKDNFKLKK